MEVKMTIQGRIKQLRDEYLTISCWDNWTDADKVRLYEIAEEIRKLEILAGLDIVLIDPADPAEVKAAIEEFLEGERGAVRPMGLRWLTEEQYREEQDLMERRDEVGL
jgi:hypothetical protein